MIKLHVYGKFYEYRSPKKTPEAKVVYLFFLLLTVKKKQQSTQSFDFGNE